jgi:hypothetical protein
VQLFVNRTVLCSEAGSKAFVAISYKANGIIWSKGWLILEPGDCQIALSGNVRNMEIARERKILIYFDTSAIVPYYVPKKLSAVVEQLLQKQEDKPISAIYFRKSESIKSVQFSI